MRGPALAAPAQSTLNAALAVAAQSKDGLTFVTDARRELQVSWKEVALQARRFAAGLLAKGIVPGDRVALVLPTAPSFVSAFFGILLARAVPVPLYPPVRLGRLDEYHASTTAFDHTLRFAPLRSAHSGDDRVPSAIMYPSLARRT